VVPPTLAHAASTGVTVAISPGTPACIMPWIAPAVSSWMRSWTAPATAPSMAPGAVTGAWRGVVEGAVRGAVARVGAVVLETVRPVTFPGIPATTGRGTEGLPLTAYGQRPNRRPRTVETTDRRGWTLIAEETTNQDGRLRTEDPDTRTGAGDEQSQVGNRRSHMTETTD